MYRRSALHGAIARLTAVALLTAGGSVAAADELPVRDPTRPPFGAAEALLSTKQNTSLLLVSTSVSHGRSSAVINDEVVTVGSTVDGAVVTAIEPGRVTLKRGSEDILLQLFTLPVKRPAGESS